MAYLVTYRPVPGYSNLARSTTSAVRVDIENPRLQRIEADDMDLSECQWIQFKGTRTGTGVSEIVQLIASDSVLSVAKIQHPGV